MINKINVSYCVKNEELSELSVGADVNVFSHGVFSDVNLKNELTGKSDTLAEMGRISAKLNSICLFGAETDSYGLSRQSIVCCHAGRLLGISDANRSFCKDSVTSGYKIWSANGIKYGVLVDRDICSVEAVKTLANCECDVIIDISRDFCEFRPEVLVPTLSYLNGIAICFLCGGKMYASTPSGEIIRDRNSLGNNFSLSIQRRYLEYNLKTRGY